MIDIWRDENPDKREFSRRQVGLGDLKQTKDRSGFSKRRFKEFYEIY